ncbi:MAG: class I SAM-dependent methyltransferase [Halioglobus sp.]
MVTEFSHEQYAQAYPDGIESHWWNRARSWVILRLLRRYCAASVVVVEVGCGRGVEVRSLRDAGVAAHGVELAPVQALSCVAEFVFTNTDACTLEKSIRESATVLMLLDVLEHLPHPEQFLQQLLEHYPKVTRVIVTVPARQELWSNYDEYYGHHRRYSLNALDELGRNALLEPLATGYFFQWVYLPARILNVLRCKRAVKIVPPGARTRWLHSFVAKVCQLEHVVLPSGLPGTSAFGVFARQKKTD